MVGSVHPVAHRLLGPESIETLIAVGTPNSLVVSQANPSFTPSLQARALVAILWACSGLVAAYLMKRRGHEFRSLAAVGFALGPFYIPLALHHAEREREVEPLRLGKGDAGGGAVNVLIGLRGSAESVSDALKVLALLGPRTGRVTIAAAIDYESASSKDWCDVKSAAAIELELASSIASLCCRPETVIVPGLADQAFRRYAEDNGHHLILMTGPDKSDGSPGALTTVMMTDSRASL